MKTHNVKWLLVMLTLMFSSLFSFAMAENEVTIVASGICGAQGDNLTWKLDSEGTLTIDGEGDMKDYYDRYYNDGTSPWYSRRASVLSVDICKGVTSIGDYSFSWCSNLTSINIPDGVTSIGNYAFYNCPNLTSITIPNSVSAIGDSAFWSCSNLDSITIPDGITSISNSTFGYCNNLTSIIIPDSVTFIDSSAFWNCSRLSSITLPHKVTFIGSSAFRDCSSLTSIIIPDGVTSIGNYAFGDCSNLMEITIPDGVTSIGNYAFYNCTSLTGINIPDGVTTIGSYTFRGCHSLTSITIPDGVTTISDYAFDYCRNLTSIIIPDTVTLIGDSAFSGCYKLETLIIPGKDMPTIGTNAFANASPTIYCYEFSDADIWAFQNGYNTIYLNTVSLPLTLTLPDNRMLLVGDSVTVTPELFPAQENAEIVWTSSAPEIVSTENGVLTAHAMGEATITARCGSRSDSMVVTAYVEVDSFDLSASELWMVSKTTAQLSIQNLTPVGATDTFVFESSNTSTLTVDNSGLLTGLKPGDANVTVISGSGVTRECLVHVCYPVTAIEFEDCDMTILTNATMQLIASVTTSEQSFVNKLVTFASSDEAVATVDENGLVTAIRSGTTTITATAASSVAVNCEITVRNPNTLTLPAEVKTIETEAFIGIDAEKVILPDGCEQIGVQAFVNNSNLFFVYMPNSVSSIADDAFEGCSNIRFICESENTAATYAAEHNIPYSIE